jgi:hypothetical protein
MASLVLSMLSIVGGVLPKTRKRGAANHFVGTSDTAAGLRPTTIGAAAFFFCCAPKLDRVRSTGEKLLVQIFRNARLFSGRHFLSFFMRSVPSTRQKFFEHHHRDRQRERERGRERERQRERERVPALSCLLVASHRTASQVHFPSCQSSLIVVCSPPPSVDPLFSSSLDPPPSSSSGGGIDHGGFARSSGHYWIED